MAFQLSSIEQLSLLSVALAFRHPEHILPKIPIRVGIEVETLREVAFRRDMVQRKRHQFVS